MGTLEAAQQQVNNMPLFHFVQNDYFACCQASFYYAVRTILVMRISKFEFYFRHHGVQKLEWQSLSTNIIY